MVMKNYAAESHRKKLIVNLVLYKMKYQSVNYKQKTAKILRNFPKLGDKFNFSLTSCIF